MAGIFTKLSRCYQLGLFCHLGELVVTHLPAHHSLGLLGISQVGRISVTSGEERSAMRIPIQTLFFSLVLNVYVCCFLLSVISELADTLLR